MLKIVPLFLLLLAAWPVEGAGRRTLYAAAGKADITPDLKKETIWLAGYGAKGRRAQGIHDPLYARALVVSDGEKTVALVAVDSIGLFRNDVLAIRRTLGWEGGGRYLFLAATHDHSAPDTLGLWGRFPGVSGVDKRYHNRLKRAIVNLVKDAASRLQEARMAAARRMLDPRGLCRDYRDPIVIDPELNALSFETKEGKAIGTLVRWSCHPEVMGSDNRQVTADFPGALCARVEEKTGGGCVFFPGVVGGLLSPDVDREGLEQRFEAMGELGVKVADLALDALDKGSVRYPRAEVSFSTRVVRVPVENSRYILFLRSLVFGHTIYGSGGEPLSPLDTYWFPLRHLTLFPLPERLRPWVETEVSHVRLGKVRILGVPGEIFPELAIGGYDGRHRYGHPLVGPANPNPPDLSAAPPGPYLREMLKAEHGLIVGLANDEIGYIVPEYDFQATANRAMSPRPPGTHYEETNSVGQRATPIILKAAGELLK
ncbi:MAG: neutral/alkaline non-lysosomal ceramidase N-terminal domain-containing protein [Elusimicrobiota bacterium]